MSCKPLQCTAGKLHSIHQCSSAPLQVMHMWRRQPCAMYTSPCMRSLGGQGTDAVRAAAYGLWSVL